ncbi:hypothetical protein MLD38_035236 [Melastoma candidum]|uniref:Uncharacterized protein n=1 Tax=Melastoma candidum TaxID=119954 RepID=A0ACB9MEM4_9MYRT|nr:hypothetical protein MLD38_035236 [Melastoma candidum]
MSTCKQLQRQAEIRPDDHARHKWCVSLDEESFRRFFGQGSGVVREVFGEGSLFSPLLFGKFFDPSDAFPLWEFDPSIILAGVRSRSGGHNGTDWFRTGNEYGLRSELPGEGSVQIWVDEGKIMEISGLWKKGQGQGQSREWRCGRWWEHGFVRRLELPEDADWKRAEAKVDEESNSLEIIIPIKASPPPAAGND